MKFSNMIIILNMIYLHFGEVERLMLFLKMTSNFYLIKIFKNVKYILFLIKSNTLNVKSKFYHHFKYASTFQFQIGYLFIYLF